MTRNEFAKIMGYVAAAIGKPMAEKDADAEIRMGIYFDLLGGLAAESLQTAARRVVLDHTWATFPTPAEFARAVAAVTTDAAGKLWDAAYRAACRCDPAQSGPYMVGSTLYNSQVEYLMSQLPPAAAEVVQCMGGLKVLSNADANYARPQFLKLCEQLQQRRATDALLPPPVKDAAALVGRLPAIGAIGRMDMEAHP